MDKLYCKAKGKEIIDQHGHPLYLKGVGIGGWLLLEGYMIKSYQMLDRPRRIKEYIGSYISEGYADYFFEEWFRRFFQEKDIQLIKEEGFNCIRIPLDYQFLFEASEDKETLCVIESHFEMLDQMIAESRKQGIYVILDLHAAPGGQTGTNIDNSSDDIPRLFLNNLYQKQTIFVWKTLAKRYKNEEYIVAYDLLNEPLPNWFSSFNNQLMPLYEEIIKEIRKVDPHHMITLEGLHWSTDLSIFSSLEDDNILLQFHKYWSNPDQESINDYLDLREKLHVPLIMGEGGENNKEWYSAVFKMYEQLNISYAFWTYKKMDMNNSIVSFKKPINWEAFLTHTLSKKEAKDVLDELLEYIQFDHSFVHHEVSKHIMCKDTFTTPAYAFDYEGEGISRHNVKVHETSFRKSQGLRIANQKNEIITPNFKQYNGESMNEEDVLYLYLLKDEWVNYTFYASKKQMFVIEVIGEDVSNIILSMNQTEHQSIDGKIQIELKNGNHLLNIYAKNDVKLKEIIFKATS